MGRVNPFALTPPPRKEWTVTLTDPSQPGVQPQLVLTELNVIEQLAALERAEALTEKHIKGTSQQPPLPFPPVGGRAVEGLSEKLFEAASLIERAQSGPVEDRYSAQEIVALMVVPGFALALLDAASQVEGCPDPFGADPPSQAQQARDEG